MSWVETNRKINNRGGDDYSGLEITRKVREVFVYKHTGTIESVLAYFLRKIKTLRGNNTRILMIENAKLSGYYFYINLII